MDMEIDIQYERALVRHCIILASSEHQLASQVKKQLLLLKIIYTIRTELKIMSRDIVEKSKNAIKYLNCFKYNNKRNPIKSIMTNISNSPSQSLYLIFFFNVKKECS